MSLCTWWVEAAGAHIGVKGCVRLQLPHREPGFASSQALSAPSPHLPRFYPRRVPARRTGAADGSLGSVRTWHWAVQALRHNLGSCGRGTLGARCERLTLLATHTLSLASHFLSPCLSCPSCKRLCVEICSRCTTPAVGEYHLFFASRHGKVTSAVLSVVFILECHVRGELQIRWETGFMKELGNVCNLWWQRTCSESPKLCG